MDQGRKYLPILNFEEASQTDFAPWFSTFYQAILEEMMYMTCDNLDLKRNSYPVCQLSLIKGYWQKGT